MLRRKISTIYTVKKRTRPEIPTMTNGVILPPNNFELHDPFLICCEDWFHYPGGFDFHPHCGFETITLVFDGLLNHQDSKGNITIIGQTQWIKTGRGLLHKEIPNNKETKVHLMQLWLNLPRSNKGDEATYQNLPSSKIPIRNIPSLKPQNREKNENSATIRIISGKSGDFVGPAKNVVPVKALDITIFEPDYTLEEDIPANYNMFIFVLEGKGIFGDEEINLEAGKVLISAPVSESEELSSVLTIRNNSKDSQLRVILFAGKPIKEPVVQHGPFIGNNWVDILKAKQNFMLGKFAGL
ncbi:hypothetical protein G9A89_003564 [Geosiphon pyriformis]|nr:hypothetical protein G9A89_003564 [Geosiphon pyriformis]